MVNQHSNTALRALVVDDETAVRRLMISALTKEGFQCDEAADGQQATLLAEKTSYQLVVTDLAMPNRHGHALIVDLLDKPNRPVVAVLTGVLDPRMAKDLMTRGVDDIIFKPVEFLPLAAKLRSIVDRRRNLLSVETPARASRLSPSHSRPGGDLQPISMEEVRLRLRDLAQVPPVSQTAVEVYQLTASPESNVQQVAAAVQREPALVTDVLRFANSSFFNPSGKQIIDVEDAVVRLGQNRVGELAVTTATAAAVAQENIPFMPLAPVWRRCLAAGICMEVLTEQSNYRESADGLFVTAVMQPMCRVIVASLFPRQYERMLKQCLFEGKSLTELEQKILPETPGAIAADVLSLWGLPEEIHRPLRHATLPFHLLSELPEFVRQRVEFIKTAVLLGQIATGHFDAWDLVDLPPSTVLPRLGIKSIGSLIQQCSDDLEAIANWSADAASKSLADSRSAERRAIRSLAYKQILADTVDLMPYIAACGDVRLTSTTDEISDIEDRLIVNCVGTPLQQLVRQLRVPAHGEMTLLATRDQAEKLGQYGPVVTLPCSYAALQKALARQSEATPVVRFGGAVAPPVTAMI